MEGWLPFNEMGRLWAEVIQEERSEIRFEKDALKCLSDIDTEVEMATRQLNM